MTSPDEPTQPQPDDEGRRDEPRPEDPHDGERRDEPRPEDPRAGEPRPRRLTRSSSDRIIGGVAGGIGRHLGIDPILVRVAFILLCFAGGAGIIAYLALLAFVPSDDGRPVSQTNRTTSVIATIALAVAVVVFLGPPAIFLGPGLLVLALFAVVAVLVYRATGGAEDPARAIARAGLILLAILAAFGAAVGVGFLAALGGGVVIGILTVVAGLALVATAFVGGARWLIVPALVLALPLAVVAAADIDIRGGIGDRTYQPQDAAAVKPKYELGMGRLDIDLRDAQLPPGQTNVKVDLGVGESRIRVADDVCVTTNADIGVGAATVFGQDNGGVDVAYADGGHRVDPTRPVLHIDANIGAGHLDVDRGGFDTTRWWDRTVATHSGVACP
jgi:phage shock protein PspC (stress-responsive transcriptional regulator)